MSAAPAVLLAIAAELSRMAKDSMPKMREGEKISREWYESGFYYRETALNGHVFIAEYDFRQRTCRFLADDEVKSIH